MILLAECIEPNEPAECIKPNESIEEGVTTSLVPHHRPESFWDFGGGRHEPVGRSGWERGRYLFECVGRRVDVSQPAAQGFHCGGSMERRVHPHPP